MSDPIRVFVGCAAGGEDAESCAVMEYTLRKHASQPVELTWLRLDDSPYTSGWNTAGWATPFAGLRWAVPAICEYQGRAVYTDSDVILMSDIAELWDQPLDGKLILARGGGKLRTCVMLMDCSDRWPFSLDKLRYHNNPNSLVTKWLKMHPEIVGSFDGHWNCLDLKGVTGLDDPALKLIHYSQMAHQPHLKHAAARLAQQGREHWYDGETAPHWKPELQELFDRLLVEAEQAGFFVDSYDWGVYEPVSYDKRSWMNRPAKVKVA